jgi:isoleucyl-tRNA synthetase
MLNFKENEEKILKFWKESRIYEKLRKKNENGKEFYMMDGPPYATGSIHMGTALNKILKDIVMRSMRMRGLNVFDRPGYYTHGVPIEFQIEKEIGSKSKQDIEKFGVKNFIEKCRKYATQHIEVMNSEFENLGVWMDWSNPYLTLDDNYIEAIWWTFKKADEKGLLYLGKYPVHICPRCETAVAYNEIVYSKQDDTSVYVKFPVAGEKNKFLIIWTTTPWTLPGNTGVMVHPDYKYAEIKLSSGELWIIAEDLVEKIMPQLGLGYSVEEVFKGKTLEGLRYANPLAKNLKLKTKNAYKVVLSSRYVNLEDGTGLVHCAPGHGKEDYEVGKANDLDIISPVDMSGTLTEEAGKYAGKKARIVDAEIIKDLEESGNLVYKHTYTHDYPLCWRCKSPLLMISVPQWFFKINDIQKRLLNLNEEVNWIPSWMQSIMKDWLNSIGDWPISRKRYWGTPLPIWICKKCNSKFVVGSIDELKKLSGAKKISLHKPEIDEVKIKCKCGAEMSRVSEVLDVWFDAGVSSWAALGFPKKKDLFEKFWPANINIEGKDQVRGWWNSQLILSEISFDKKPFENVIVHGMVLDLGKKKMSKSLGNIVSPQDIIKKYGRDAIRYYFAKISKGEDFAFNEPEFLDVTRVLTILQNVSTYAGQAGKGKESPKKLEIEDKWILSRLNSAIKEVSGNYNSFLLPKVVEDLENFMVKEVSRGYIQMIRERVESKDDSALATLNAINISLLKLFSPICPFMTETIYQGLKEKFGLKEESVHLCEFPKADEKKIDKKLESEMQVAQQIIEKIMAARADEKISVRWPLANAEVSAAEAPGPELQKLVAKQCNLKKINFKKTKQKEIIAKLDTKMTEDLEAEGYAREIARRVQEARKKAGLHVGDKIELVLQLNTKIAALLKKFSQTDYLEQKTSATKLMIMPIGAEIKNYQNKSEDKIRDNSVVIFFNKINS